MNYFTDAAEKLAIAQGLLVAFALVGLIVLLSQWLAKHVFRGRIHASAIAIVIGLALACWGGLATQVVDKAGHLTHGKKGLADISWLAGVGLMGGAMLRDFAIVATAFDVNVREARRAGLVGAVALFIGTVMPFALGAAIAYAFGYRDAVSITTIGAGAVTYIVGPVTGAAIGASSAVMALSVATGVLKAILVMVVTPMVARFIGLDNPRTAMVFGGLMGTVSGVSAGLAAVDPKLVPYGALTSAFHTGLGCLMGPSVLFFTVKAVLGS